jgi:hypothetical protein
MVGDDATRARYGVLISLKRISAGELRVVVDRVSREEDGAWIPRTPVTFKDFVEADIVDAK